MPNLKPYRQYSENDVVNGLFSYSGPLPINKGTIVKITNNYKDAENQIFDITELSTHANGVVAPLFGTIGRVATVVNFNDNARPLGVLLKDVRDIDENGDLLLYNPRKAAEMDCLLPHQSVPILVRGIIMVNDFDLTDRGGGGGVPNPGDSAYVGNNGKIATEGLVKIGQFLSAIDQDGYAIVRISF
jgi:hypothetical protein